MRARYIIGGVIILVFVIWGGLAFVNTTVRYVPIEEARAAQRTVQVLGAIDTSTVRYDQRETRLEFAIYDIESPDPNSAERLSVHYYGPIPGNFDQATSVVVKGRSEGDFFVAEQMFVKCPSKYQGDSRDEYQDIRKHDEGAAQAGT